MVGDMIENGLARHALAKQPFGETDHPLEAGAILLRCTQGLGGLVCVLFTDPHLRVVL